MTQSSQKLRYLADNFVIPAGSQVVLLSDQPSDKRTATSDQHFKKLGTVGVVVKCPPHNGQLYLIRFADESEMEVPFEQLTLRR